MKQVWKTSSFHCALMLLFFQKIPSFFQVTMQFLILSFISAFMLTLVEIVQPRYTAVSATGTFVFSLRKIAKIGLIQE